MRLSTNNFLPFLIPQFPSHLWVLKRSLRSTRALIKSTQAFIAKTKVFPTLWSSPFLSSGCPMVLTNEILHVIYPVYWLSDKPFEISLLFLGLVIQCFKWFVFFSGAVNKRLRAYYMKLYPSHLWGGKKMLCQEWNTWLFCPLLESIWLVERGGWVTTSVWATMAVEQLSCGNTHIFSPVQMLQKRHEWGFVTAVAAHLSHHSVHREWLAELQQPLWTPHFLGNIHSHLSAAQFPALPLLTFQAWGWRRPFWCWEASNPCEIQCRILLKLMGPFPGSPFCPWSPISSALNKLLHPADRCGLSCHLSLIQK